jgi:serine/threonine-protein kinase RIM15
LLKQANDDVIKKMKSDQMVPLAQTLGDPVVLHHRKRSLSQRIKKPSSVSTNFEPRVSSENSL